MSENLFFERKGPFPLKDILKVIGYNGNINLKNELIINSFPKSYLEIFSSETTLKIPL